MADERTSEIVDQVRDDHSRLDELFSQLREAIADGVGTATVADLFTRLRTSLEVHLAQEDRVYYPGLRDLRPEHRRMLDAFSAAHDEFRGELAEIAEAIGDAFATEAERRIEALARHFEMHESAEELLLQRIDDELREGLRRPA